MPGGGGPRSSAILNWIAAAQPTTSQFFTRMLRYTLVISGPNRLSFLSIVRVADPMPGRRPAVFAGVDVPDNFGFQVASAGQIAKTGPSFWGLIRAATSGYRLL